MIRRVGPLGVLALSWAAAFSCHGSDGVVATQDAGTDGGGAHPLCVNGQSVDGAYPKVDYALKITETIPDLSFDGIDETGMAKRISLHDYFEPCAAKARMIVLRASGAWCGTCRWDVGHTRELRDLDVGSRIIVLDLLIANEDNVPAALRDLSAWRARMDSTDGVAIDPSFSLAPLNPTREPLPYIAIVDTWTMKIRFAQGNPDRDTLTNRIRSELAELDGAPAPTPAYKPAHDELFSAQQWDMMHDMTLPGAPPPDPTNAKADDPSAAALGKVLFSDASLSPTNNVSCATCHDSMRGFTDARPQSLAAGITGDRNAPSVLFASHARWQFWDGRADTLWSQALGPFENPKEFNASRLFVAHAVYANRRAAYEAVFGAMPDLSNTTRFPPSGKPGDAAWTAMTADDQRAVTRVFVNIGKSIAAFERTLRATPNRFDAYLAGDLTTLTKEEKGSVQNFFIGGCASCHYGPRLTDDAFHNTRFPTGRQDGQADRGRIDGIATLLASEFRADREFSDAPTSAHGITGLVADPSTLGAFKTPALRGVPATGPFGHGGTVATLLEVAKLYGTAGLDPADGRAVGSSEPWIPKFSQNHAEPLVPFLQLLTAEPAP